MTSGNSAAVRSNQAGVHPRLEHAVRKHLERPWSPPIARHNDEAFARWHALYAQDRRPLILDSGCGTGESALLLARRIPDCAVVGVDRSAMRLARRLDGATMGIRAGVVFLRCELAQFWRLAHGAGVRVERHYLLYPNPWPKSVHYKRRWAAHPALADLLALSGDLELRTNWRVYADEFALALEIAGRHTRLEALRVGEEASSPFERKYRESGQALWRVNARL